MAYKLQLNYLPMDERALIVDHDVLIHYAISKALTPYCPEVKAVSNRADAIREIDSCFYPLCFLDISPSEGHNFPLLKEIKEKSPGTKVVVMTGGDLDDASKKKIDESCYSFLAKPFEISELKAIARQALGKTDDTSFGSDNRRCARSILNKVVYFTVTVIELGKPNSLTLKGNMVDLSEKGLGLRTYYPLEAGQLIVFTNGFPEGGPKTGIVRWSSLTDNSYMYRVGVEFVEK